MPGTENCSFGVGSVSGSSREPLNNYQYYFGGFPHCNYSILYTLKPYTKDVGNPGPRPATHGALGQSRGAEREARKKPGFA